jgi:hypothetical protein
MREENMKWRNMATSPVIFSEPWDVNRRLYELGGLTQEILRKAIIRGHAAWAACSTTNHPRIFPPFANWANVMCGLTDEVVSVPLRWEPEERAGQPLVVSPNGAVAITASSGDDHTGMIGEGLMLGVQPRTRAPKGIVTIEAVKRNLLNKYLFTAMEADAQKEIEKSSLRKQNTWILLFCRDLLAGEVRSELSRPIKMDEDMHISKWSERIILPPVGFESIGAQDTGEGGGNDSGEITIDVKRRG